MQLSNVPTYTYETRNVDVTCSNGAQRVQRYRLKKRHEYVDLIENWLDQLYGERDEQELTVREVLPVLAKHPRIVGELALFVRSGGNDGATT